MCHGWTSWGPYFRRVALGFLCLLGQVASNDIAMGLLGVPVPDHCC